MTINNVLIAGAGAIGLSVAETIYRAEPERVSILAKGERLERYRKNGLRVNGEKLGFRFYGDAGEKAADLIIVACKFHHLNKVIEDMAPAAGPDTIILSLLNGISSEEIIGRKFGRERLPLAMILGTDAFHAGEETTYTRKGVIHFGAGDGNNGAREQAIADFFTRIGMPFKLEADMRRSLWFKYMLNVGVNQTTAVLRLPYAAIAKKGGPEEIPDARDLMENAMREVIAVANAEGIDLGPGDIEDCYRALNLLDPKGYTSMCQDILAGRKTEVEMFSLALLELGKKHHIPLPVNGVLYQELRVIERRQAAAHTPGRG